MDLIKAHNNFDGILTINTGSFQDERGLFQRIYCDKELSGILKGRKIKQVNHSYTINKGSIRGLHFQKKPFEELKIIYCIQGSIFDVVVDLRKNSDTFGKYFSITLDSKDFNALVVPEGFAHGFQTLTNNVRMIYFY